MIEDYFAGLESVLSEFPIIRSYELTKKVYNIHQGYMRGKVTFENGYSLEFAELVDIEQAEKVKYRYHCMDEGQNLLFRYDTLLIMAMSILFLITNTRQIKSSRARNLSCGLFCMRFRKSSRSDTT